MFNSLHILTADFLPLDGIQRRHNIPYKYILLAISFYSRFAHAVSLFSKRGMKLLELLNLSLSKILIRV